MLLSRLWNSVFTTNSAPAPNGAPASEHTFLEIDSAGRTRVHNVYGRNVADVHADICRVLGGTHASMDRYSSKSLSAELVMWYDHSGGGGPFNATASALVHFEVQGSAVVVSRNRETQELHSVTLASWERDAADLRGGRRAARRPAQLRRLESPARDTRRTSTSNDRGPASSGSSSKEDSAPSPPSPREPPVVAGDADEAAAAVASAPPTLQLRRQQGRAISSLIKEPKSTVATGKDPSRGRKRQQKGWIYLSEDEAQKRHRKPQLFDVDNDAGTTFVPVDGTSEKRRTSRRLARMN